MPDKDFYLKYLKYKKKYLDLKISNGGDDTEWEMWKDVDSGELYYYNRATNESQWEKPNSTNIIDYSDVEGEPAAEEKPVVEEKTVEEKPSKFKSLVTDVMTSLKECNKQTENAIKFYNAAFKGQSCKTRFLFERNLMETFKDNALYNELINSKCYQDWIQNHKGKINLYRMRLLFNIKPDDVECNKR